MKNRIRETLHSNMSLLIFKLRLCFRLLPFAFTFQYVSININTVHKLKTLFYALHSNMSLLIWSFFSSVQIHRHPLHSNMSLLILRLSQSHNRQQATLHSNMSLLISMWGDQWERICQTLHSNMSLLILFVSANNVENEALYIPICLY